MLGYIFQYDIALNGEHDFLSPRKEPFIERVLQRLLPLLKEGNPPISVKSSDTDIKASGPRLPGWKDKSLLCIFERNSLYGATLFAR